MCVRNPLAAGQLSRPDALSPARPLKLGLERPMTQVDGLESEASLLVSS